MTDVVVGAGERTFVVERRGVQPVPAAERRGRPSNQFTMWLGANLTIADFALGFLAVTLGLPWALAVGAVLVGNVLGAAALAAAAAMGPSYGLPQMVLVRGAFGSFGGRLPALLNYVSTLGWYTVNTILASFGLVLLIPGLAFWQGALALVLVQAVLGVYGHHLVHGFERAMSVVLGLLFLALTVYVLTRHGALAGYHPAGHGRWPAFAIMVAAALSYVGSWSPYGADYSRYLPAGTSRGAVARWAFLGAFVASAWLELLGTAVAVLAGGHAANATAAAHSVLGGFGDLAVVAIILGGVAANAVNVYSNSLSAGAVGLALPRWALAVLASGIGLAASLASFGNFASDYEDFLLLLGYWFTPWLGVQAVDFYLLRRRGVDRPGRGAVAVPALAAFLVGIGAEIPFMSSTLYTGPVAASLGGADVSFYLGFTVAGLAYLLLGRRTRGRS
jgi:NCS1 family nucleobase:cation symporter-1